MCLDSVPRYVGLGNGPLDGDGVVHLGDDVELVSHVVISTGELLLDIN